MKKVNGLLSKVLNKRELELETFDLIDVFASDFDEKIEDYKSHAAKLEMDVSQEVIPFPLLTDAEKNTWEVFCPRKHDLKDYTETVPLEVIKLATEVQKRGWFYKVQVWSEHAEEVDPILVGVLNDKWGSPLYLLARWGASLKPYEEVREIAKKMWRENREATLKKDIKEAQRRLEDIDEDCVRYFSGRIVY